MSSATTKLSAQAKDNLAFIESYFSNYIEGTCLTIDEALDLIYNEHKEPVTHDEHDVAQTHAIVRRNMDNPVTFSSYEDFARQIKAWHAEMFSHSSKALPGQFKTKNNQAGTTSFVVKEKVEATLRNVFKMYQTISDPVKRAVFLKTAFVDVHPFQDGNGRISRLLLNNELSAAGLRRLFVPNVFRDDYITSLGNMKDHDYQPLLTMFNHMDRINSEINMETSLESVIAQIAAKHGFADASETKWGSPSQPSNNQASPEHVIMHGRLKK